MAGMFGSMMGQSSAGSGWSRVGRSLGEAMSGAPQQRYDESMLRGHRVQRALMDAKKATDEYNARAGLEDTLRDALPPEQQHLVPYITGAQRAGVNPVQGLQAPREAIRSQAAGQAYSQAMSGDMDAANRMIAVSAQSPLRQAQVSGNTMFNPNVAPEAQTPQLTEYGSGQLDNQAERTRGLNEASMTSAMRAGTRRGAAGADPGSIEEQAQQTYEKMLDDAAKEIWHDARLEDRDLYGLNEKDIRHSLATRGEARDRDGNVIGRFDVSPESLMNPQADFSSVRGSVVGSTASPASAMSGAPVSEPRGAVRPPVSGVMAGGTNADATIPDEAISYLRANPSLAEAFDAKYGAGSAARYLGQ